MSATFLLIITSIGEAHGDVYGRLILAVSTPLLRSANFSRNFGTTRRTRYTIGLAPPTSISRPSPRSARINAFTVPIRKWRCLQTNCRILFWSSVKGTSG